MSRKIKFIANAVRWFDRINGNTYCSVRITRCRDGKVIHCPFQYGYGSYYRQAALEKMAYEKWLPVEYRDGSRSPYAFESENDYPIEWVVSDGLKRDCVSNGTA